MASPYAELIEQLAPDYDPRHIEAYLRCEHGTLDHLSEEQLDGAIDFAKSLVDQGGAEAAETLARSYGLNPERIGCGCCKGPEYDRCICHMHQDITRGRPARTCLCHRVGAQAAAAGPAEGAGAADLLTAAKAAVASLSQPALFPADAEAAKTWLRAAIQAEEARRAQSAPSNLLDNYRRLHDGLSDMIEGGRLTRAEIPDDYDWLVEAMVWLAGHDPVPGRDE